MIKSFLVEAEPSHIGNSIVGLFLAAGYGAVGVCSREIVWRMQYFFVASCVVALQER